MKTRVYKVRIEAEVEVESTSSEEAIAKVQEDAFVVPFMYTATPIETIQEAAERGYSGR